MITNGVYDYLIKLQSVIEKNYNFEKDFDIHKKWIKEKRINIEINLL